MTNTHVVGTAKEERGRANICRNNSSKLLKFDKKHNINIQETQKTPNEMT